MRSPRPLPRLLLSAAAPLAALAAGCADHASPTAPGALPALSAAVGAPADWPTVGSAPYDYARTGINTSGWPIPSGYAQLCSGIDDGRVAECPVLRWGDYTYWAYSDVSNDHYMVIVAYNSSGAIVRRWVRWGARYLSTITVDADAQTVTFAGQAGLAIGMTWADLSVSPPAVTPSLAGTLGSGGWYTGNVVVSWSVSDAESAVSSTTGCDQEQVTEDTPGRTFTCVAFSSGGMATKRVTVRRDATGPTLAPTFTQNPALLGASVTASANAEDAVSGVASASCGAVSTAVVGPAQTVACTATDNAGNTTRASAIYAVHYPFGGFAAPVGGAPAVNQVRAGSAVPVTFALGGDRGLALFKTGYPRFVGGQCGGEPHTGAKAATAGGGLTYDATSGAYTFLWKTEKGWAGLCGRLELGLRDGSEHHARFAFSR
jgi:xanthosine utilization system XapX-like protein